MTSAATTSPPAGRRTVEITGGGSHNGGAELMLRTAAAAVRSRFPGSRPCVSRPLAFERRAAYGLWRIVPQVVRGPKAVRTSALAAAANRLAADALPDKLLDAGGFVRPAEVDAVLDISGYAYGDFWPAPTIAAISKKLAARPDSVPFVLLPQMFGPFEEPAVREAFRPLADRAALAFARDRRSHEYLSEFVPPDRLRLCPDITIPVARPAAKDDAPDRPPYACLVPNSRMLDKGGDEWAGVYVDRLLDAGRLCRAAGFEVAVVKHAGDAGDGRLVAQVHDRLRAEPGPAVRAFDSDDPVELKREIGRAELLVGSRFHAVVAALSSGVPAVVMGWAHKYAELLRDFERPAYLVAADDGAAGLAETVRRLADDPEHLAAEKTHLRGRADALAGQVEEMWEEVWSVLDGAGTAA